MRVGVNVMNDHSQEFILKPQTLIINVNSLESNTKSINQSRIDSETSNFDYKY